MRGVASRRVRVLGVAAVALMALAACDPVVHDDFTVKEQPASSPVTFELLSGDANYAVVRATGAGATVPAPGVWRVDRRDGSTAELPDAGETTRISRDGTRVLFQPSSGPPVLWSDGTTLTPPASTQLSDDLTHGAFVDTDGTVKTWDSATQTVTAVEPAFPRPPGTTSAVARDVSDDGNTVQYTLRGSQTIERFANLDTGTVVDRPNLDASDEVRERFVLAASGTAFVHAYEQSYVDYDCPCVITVESWAERVSLPDGAVGARYENTTDEGIAEVLMAPNGDAAWVYQERSVVGGSGSGCPQGPAASVCVVDSSVVAVRQWGHRAFDTGSGDLGSIAVSRSGRLLAIDKGIVPESVPGVVPNGPVRVFDWVTQNVESLDDAITYTEAFAPICATIMRPAPCQFPALSQGAQFSDDLPLVATTSHKGGWYEYSVAPEPPPA